jgi:putative Mg2+ transporter-C (MgtC) family protein
MLRSLTINYGVFAYHLAAAFLFGSLIGAERQRRQRTAGLRTNALVCVGAAIFVLLGRLMSASNDSVLRVAAQVVSGIGFLGGGVIFREGLSVQGLNTAATLWCSGAVGTLCGAGYLVEAGMGVAAVLSANLFLRRIARKIEQPRATDGDTQIHYSFRVVCRSQDENYIRQLLLSSMVEPNLVLHALHTADVQPATGNVEIRADLICQGRQEALLERTVTRLSLEPSVSAVSWDITGQELEA